MLPKGIKKSGLLKQWLQRENKEKFGEMIQAACKVSPEYARELFLNKRFSSYTGRIIQDEAVSSTKNEQQQVENKMTSIEIYENVSKKLKELLHTYEIHLIDHLFDLIELYKKAGREYNQEDYKISGDAYINKLRQNFNTEHNLAYEDVKQKNRSKIHEHPVKMEKLIHKYEKEALEKFLNLARAYELTGQDEKMKEAYAEALERAKLWKKRESEVKEDLDNFLNLARAYDPTGTI